VAPLADLAALSLLSARRFRSGWAAAGAGLIGGLGTYIYLSAWIAGLGLVILALWPIREYPRERIRDGWGSDVGVVLARKI
jgi:hypothetical protein